MIPAQRLTASTSEDYPSQEANRLAVLRGLNLLDSPPSETFDRVTRLAARTLGVPIVLVSLVDETRQWFKSRFGLDVTQTPREASICAHAVLSRSPLVVPDALLDARFAANPLVTGAPFIRAYAGVPLFTRLGHAIGTLCAIDRQPREFARDEIAALADYARVLQDSIQAQEIAAQSDSVLQLANARERLFHDTFEFSAVGMVHLTLTGRLIRCNQALGEMLGFAPHELCQASVIDLTHPEDLARSAVNFRQICAGEIARYSIEKRLQRFDKSYIWCHLSVSAKFSAGGEPEYLIAIVEDINQRMLMQSEAASSRESLEAQVAAQAQQLKDSNAALRTHVKKLLDSESAVRQTAQRLRAIANSVPAMIGYWNRDLVCEFANEAYRGWFGIAPEEVVGRTMPDLLGLKIFASAEPRARLALQGQSQRFEQQAQMPDGTTAHLDVRYIPDVEENRSVRGFFVLVTETTASSNVQTALHAANGG
jgi:PAS domain S-box-containing protein